jgi:hypothetical protein
MFAKHREFEGYGLIGRTNSGKKETVNRMKRTADIAEMVLSMPLPRSTGKSPNRTRKTGISNFRQSLDGLPAEFPCAAKPPQNRKPTPQSGFVLKQPHEKTIGHSSCPARL